MARGAIYYDLDSESIKIQEGGILCASIKGIAEANFAIPVVVRPTGEPRGGALVGDISGNLSDVTGYAWYEGGGSYRDFVEKSTGVGVVAYDDDSIIGLMFEFYDENSYEYKKLFVYGGGRLQTCETVTRLEGELFTDGLTVSGQIATTVRPTVNGSGVLLQGEVVSLLADYDLVSGSDLPTGMSYLLPTGIDSTGITFPRAFPNVPNLVFSINSPSSSWGYMVQASGISTAGCQVSFSDDIQEENVYLNIIANFN